MSSNPNETWLQIKCAECGVDEETHQNLGPCEDGDCGHGWAHHVGGYRDATGGYCCVTECPCASYSKHSFREPER